MAEDAENQTSLVATLGEMNKGKDLVKIDAGYAELLESVKTNGGKGSITVKLTVSFVQALDNDVAQVGVSIGPASFGRWSTMWSN